MALLTLLLVLVAGMFVVSLIDEAPRWLGRTDSRTKFRVVGIENQFKTPDRTKGGRK